MKEKAVALQYRDLDQLPKVISAGCGEAARQIVEIAKAHGVPVQRDQELAELLGELPVGSKISPQCFHMVAEIICFLYMVDQKWREARPNLMALGEALPLEKRDQLGADTV